MSKNKFGSFSVNEKVLYKGEEYYIVSKQKGNKTKSVNKQGGIITGNKSKPCTYTLSNNLIVRGDKLKKIK